MPVQWLVDKKIYRTCKICKERYRVTSPRQFACINCNKERKKRRFAEYYKKNYKKIREKARKADRGELAKARYKRYRSKQSYKEYARNRYHSLPENIKKARYYVRNAVRDNRLEKKYFCEKCGKKDWGKKRSMIEAHHYRGYDKEHWLEVQWLCVDCHKVVDGREEL